MGKFDQLVLDKTEQGEMSFTENQSLKEDLLRMHQLLNSMELEKQEDKKTFLINKINTTIGFLNQLSLRLTHPYLADLSLQIEQKKQSIIEKLEESKNLQDEATLLSTLERIEKDSSSYYHQAKEAASNAVDQGILSLEKRETLLKQVEPMVLQIDSLSDSAQLGGEEETLKQLADLYSKALRTDIKSLKGLEEEVALLNEFQTLGLPFLNTTQGIQNQISITDTTGKDYPLFAKINDQIIDFQSFPKDGKIYVKYLLEDGKYYFAVVEAKDAIDEAYRNFEQNSFLSHEQSKEAWKKNLEIVLSCLQMYYQINEFMRYQEITNRGEITQEKDLEIRKYKELLSFMETGILKQYLEYSDLLSQKTLHGENKASSFYLEEEGKSKTKRACENIVVSVLGNQDAKKEVTSRQILESLYDVELPTILFEMEQSKKEQAVTLEPLAMVEDVKEEAGVELSSLQETNYDKIESYFKKRKDLISRFSICEDIIPQSIRKDDRIYKDVNIYLDLEEARQITNQLYLERNKGQGDYALLAYLKEGKLEGFTSKYQARNLASFVKREDYFYLMLVQSIKDYATFNEQKKRNEQFGFGIENLFILVGQAVLEEEFQVEKLVTNLFDDDTMLPSMIRNFDGRYLIEEKGDNPLFEKVLKDYQTGNPFFATKVTNALSTLRKKFKQDSFQLPSKSSVMEVAIPSGKVTI